MILKTSFRKQLQTCLKQMQTRKLHQRNRRYNKKEPDGSFRTVKYNNQNIKISRQTQQQIERTEERLNELKDETREILQSEQKKEYRLEKNEQSHRDLWDYNEKSNICVSGVPEKEIGLEKTLKKIMTKNV